VLKMVEIEQEASTLSVKDRNSPNLGFKSSVGVSNGGTSIHIAVYESVTRLERD